MLPTVKTGFARVNSFPPLAIRAQLRWDVVRPIVAAAAPATTIEVGVGQGAMGARIASMTSQSYLGFEIDEDSCERASARISPFGGVVYAKPLDTVGPDPADLVCAFEVLEHIEDDRAALVDWTNYIVPGGHFVMSVPANPDRFGAMDRHAGHFRRYSPLDLTTLVESVGMRDVSAKLYGSPLGYALEAVRNRIDEKKLANAGDLSIEELTAASGRTFQFDQRSWKSTLATAGTFPFKYLQRVCPGGTGLVLHARKPL
jgi:SAM-dependent methyltransferase